MSNSNQKDQKSKNLVENASSVTNTPDKPENSNADSPKFLGSGTYGCAYKPPIQCNDGDQHPNAITKLMTSDNANDEIKEYDVIKKVDPEGLFTVSALRVCKPNLSSPDLRSYVDKTCTPTKNKELEKLALIVLEDGGIDLDKMVKNINRISDKDVRRYEIKKMLVRMMDIITGVDKFTAAGIAHRDIKLQNTVFNEDTGATKFIDFGMTLPFDEIEKEASKNKYWLGDRIFWSVPPYCLLFAKDRYDFITEKKGNARKLFPMSTITSFKTYLEKYVGSFLTQYKNNLNIKIVKHILLSFDETISAIAIDKKSYKEFMYRSCQVLDLYNVGICLMQILGGLDHADDITHNNLLFHDLIEYIKITVDCHVFQHITTETAIEIYHRLLTHHNLYEETGMEYKDGRIIDNNRLKANEDKTEEPDKNASISTPTVVHYKSPNEHREAFKKSMETNSSGLTAQMELLQVDTWETADSGKMDVETPEENSERRPTKKKSKNHNLGKRIREMSEENNERRPTKKKSKTKHAKKSSKNITRKSLSLSL